MIIQTLKYLSLLVFFCFSGFSCSIASSGRSATSSEAVASSVTAVNPNTPVASNISESELKLFGQKIYDIHTRQAKDEYLALIHPDCPAPIPEAMEYNFSQKWLENEAHDIRIKDVNESFDMNQLVFKVKPEAVLEIQTWVANIAKGKRELVTGFPVVKYQGELRVIDFPCFEPK